MLIWKEIQDLFKSRGEREEISYQRWLKEHPEEMQNALQKATARLTREKGVKDPQIPTLTTNNEKDGKQLSLPLANVVQEEKDIKNEKKVLVTQTPKASENKILEIIKDVLNEVSQQSEVYKRSKK